MGEREKLSRIVLLATAQERAEEEKQGLLERAGHKPSPVNMDREHETRGNKNTC